MGGVDGIQFGAGIFEMKLHGALADIHDMRNIPIGFARGPPAQTFLFALGQALRIIGRFNARMQQRVMMEVMRNQHQLRHQLFSDVVPFLVRHIRGHREQREFIHPAADRKGQALMADIEILRLAEKALHHPLRAIHIGPVNRQDAAQTCANDRVDIDIVVLVIMALPFGRIGHGQQRQR